MKTLLGTTLAALLPALATAGEPPQTVQSPNGQTSLTQSAVVCPTENEAARSFYNQGTDLDKAGRFEDARKAYLQAVALDPRYCDAMDNLGFTYRRAGRLDEATSWYKKSIAIAPKNGTSRMNLAAVLRMKGKLAEAAVEYAELVKLIPNDAEGHYGLGSVRFELGKAREAVGPLLEAEKLYLADESPYVSDARGVLGRAYYQLEDWSQAAKYLELAHTTSPEDPAVNLRLGTALLKLKKLDRAGAYLRKARDLGATVPPALAAQVGM